MGWLSTDKKSSAWYRMGPGSELLNNTYEARGDSLFSSSWRLWGAGISYGYTGLGIPRALFVPRLAVGYWRMEEVRFVEDTARSFSERDTIAVRTFDFYASPAVVFSFRFWEGSVKDKKFKDAILPTFLPPIDHRNMR